MKKIYTLIAAVAVVVSANAQTKGSSAASSSVHKYSGSLREMTGSSRAAGDTLMYMQLPGYTINPTDAAAFTIVTEDNDMLNPNNAGYAMDFGLYYSTDSTLIGGAPSQDNFYHPWETPAPAGTDTTFFWSATSWFSPAGIADNWLEFGPITIPAGGATLKYYDRTNRWKDGYEVLVSNTPSTPLSFGDFVTPAIYTIADDGLPSATWAVDTTWELHTVDLPAIYNGQAVSIAFHHNANDMDVLRFDEIVVVEKALGVSEFVNGAKLFQNSPNPTSANTTFTYELEKNAMISFNVFDVTGKVVASQSIGEQAAGIHNIVFSTENLAAGIYHYSLNVDNASTSAMKMVVIK
jgi:hypothetical protein